MPDNRKIEAKYKDLQDDRNKQSKNMTELINKMNKMKYVAERLIKEIEQIGIVTDDNILRLKDLANELKDNIQEE